MFMPRILPSIPFLIMLSSCQAEGKCKCVDYNRDWYVVVASFASGLVLSAILAFLLNCYCRRCGRVKPHASTIESQETLETAQSQGNLNRFYEEVPGGENDGFEEIGSFEQTFRSDSMDSRTNLVVDVTHHGECSKQADYQNPRIEMEPIYSDCATVEGKDNGQSGSDENDGTNQYGESSSTSGYQQPRKISGHTCSQANPLVVSRSKETSRITNQVNQHSEISTPSDYQHPKPNHTYMDMTVQQETNLPSECEITPPNDQLNQHGEKSTPSHYQHPKPNLGNSGIPSECGETSPTEQFNICAEASKPGDYQHPKFTPSKPPRNRKPSPPPLEEYKKPPIKNYHKKAPTNYQTPSQHAPPTKYLVPPPPKSAPPSPELVPSSPQSDLATDYRSRKNYHLYPDIGITFLDGGDQNREDETAASTTKPSSGQNLPTASKSRLPSPNSSDVKSNREADYQLPEIDAEFLQNEGHNPPQESPSLSNVESNREAGYQVPEIDAEFLENQGQNRPTPSSGNVESNRDANYQAPEIDMKFFESGDKSLIPPSSIPPSSSPPPALPSRAPSQKSPSTSLVPPDLPSKTPPQKSPYARLTKASTSSELPALPSKTSSPRIAETIVLSSSSPPALPSKAPSQKSPYARSLMATTSSPPPPTLPGKTPSVKSPTMVPSKSPTPPPVPPKAAPPLPAKTKPVSQPSPALYAELNELDRQDDAANYQHLTPTTKQ